MTKQRSYPAKTCEIEKLVTNPKMVQAATQGIKTQQRRNGIYGYPGEEFELQGTKFVITDLEEKTLGDMSDEDAKAEGYPSLEVYKNIIIKMHAGMSWNPSATVWVHTFKKKD